MSNSIDVAVVGATGAVGEVMLEILAERKFPVGKVHALASERSVGKKVEFGNRELVVGDLARGRAVRSLIYLLGKYEDIAIDLVASRVAAMIAEDEWPGGCQ